MKLSAKETAEKFVSTAKELGWKYQVRGEVLTITKNIIPGNNDSFCSADMEYFSILGIVPMTYPGSIWGTDGGGIGAMSAMNSGVFKMNMSGGSKRVLNAIKKVK